LPAFWFRRILCPARRSEISAFAHDFVRPEVHRAASRWRRKLRRVCGRGLIHVVHGRT
jgi:hypothetical protein